jgi:hypothetical protein
MVAVERASERGSPLGLCAVLRQTRDERRQRSGHHRLRLVWGRAERSAKLLQRSATEFTHHRLND